MLGAERLEGHVLLATFGYGDEFWKLGATASPGVKDVAETGSPMELVQNELEASMRADAERLEKQNKEAWHLTGGHRSVTCRTDTADRPGRGCDPRKVVTENVTDTQTDRFSIHRVGGRSWFETDVSFTRIHTRRCSHTLCVRACGAAHGTR